MKQDTMYILCCGAERGAAVIVGRLSEPPVVDEVVTVRDARMILYWDTACGGLLGVAARGPKGDTRITQQVPTTSATVREWVEMTTEAAAAIDAWPGV